MNKHAIEKVKSHHLARSAYLYIRQSTVRQVFENTESTERQYGLQQRAIDLGWPIEQIIIIDSDLGQSGSGAVQREGFQKLVTEVGMGRAGIVLGLEVSRLARNSSDWHRLIEFCALTDTLILDEDGVYDPSHFNDRLLLGLKGTMSEAELHVLRARLRGGLLNKAKRGDLRLFLPVGFIYDKTGKIIFDPDKQVQETIKLLFDTYNRTGGLYATTKYFRKEGIQFPSQIQSGPNKGKLAWKPLSLNRTARLLHNPIYAGAYVYGRSRWRKQPDGRIKYESLPKEQWQVFIKDSHPGYISWKDYENIEKRLKKNYKAAGFDKTPPREGPALLQGIAVCGLCGSRMHVHYKKYKKHTVTNYICWGRGREYTDPMCQTIRGNEIDSAISDLILKTISPKALEMSLAIQQEIAQRMEEADKIRQLQIQRAQYEADSAKQRYMHVDPTNRLVADSLEDEWNEKLHNLESVKEEIHRQRSKDHLIIDAEKKKKIMSLTRNFPAVWNDPITPDRERKKMIRLLIEDVTLIKNKQINIEIRFRGGATQAISIPKPLTFNQLRATHPEVRKQIDQLLDEYTDTQIADRLNQQGVLTGAGETFNQNSIKWIRYTTKLPSLKQRMLDKGWMTAKQLDDTFGLKRTTVMRMRVKGDLTAKICSDAGEWLYWPPDKKPFNGKSFNKKTL